MNVDKCDFLDLFIAEARYKVPRWQRRYRWNANDIKRLVADLVAVAKSRNLSKRHYGGTLLTKREHVPPGTRIQPHQVVDGQQRLTTVSILLACIADALTDSGAEVGDWTGPAIREKMVLNPTKNPYKMRLQDGDDTAYRAALDGKPSGASAVSHAWGISQAAVKEHGAEILFKGLQRLQVVSIGLEDADDPQQIFESLNATGRPLTESEKLKNWLLMGLSDEKQEQLYSGPWMNMERELQAKDGDGDPGRIDRYLRDFLRWKTGALRGKGHVYEDFRRWALRSGKDEDRVSLCHELYEVSKSYGQLVEGGGPHRHKEVERQLVHLRAIGLDTHRPFTLRLLHEARDGGRSPETGSSLAQVFTLVCTWITRFWLADRPMAGLNRAFATLAYRDGPRDTQNAVEYWADRIARLRGSRVGVPDDEAVREGIRSRKAYGGAATRATKAILCALMECEQRGGAPARMQLTVEHLMPQKLTNEWRRALGADAEEIHRWHLHRIGNLTISGVNPEMGNKPWREKRDILMKHSGVLENRRIAAKSVWNQKALEQRTERLGDAILDLWPWKDQGTSRPVGWGQLAWRIDGKKWRDEKTFRDALLNVASALIGLDPSNADRLRGAGGPKELQWATDRPPSKTVHAIPEHSMYTTYVNLSAPDIVARIQEMGRQCAVSVEVDVTAQSFWRMLAEVSGGIPGQRDDWLSGWQRSSPYEPFGDRIHITMNETWVGLYIRANEKSEGREARIRRASMKIRELMPDQEHDDFSSPKKGSTVAVFRSWQRGDREAWPEVARWIKTQFSRLEEIVESLGDALD